VQDFQTELRSRGYRFTPQRQLVLEAVTELGHATPEDVHAWVTERASGINISTVYRTLELLEDVGLVSHAHLSHGAPTYHSSTTPQHLHLICRNCGSVIEVEPEVVAPVVDRLRTEHGFVADVGHLTIFGTCQECSAREEG
jgi:Fur family transcriptional regulator, ferric uptake regulator